MSLQTSGYGQTLAGIGKRAASAIVARGKLSSQSARDMLLRRLSSAPGGPDSLLATPIYELARMWKPSSYNFGSLAGTLLREDLVAALDGAGDQALPRGLHPYQHQIEAWQSAARGRSYMVTSGTGSGKTECFMVPMLNDLLTNPGQATGAGIKAIVLYPLNALIDSQKERLSAWITPFAGRLSYAMYNRHTPDSPSPARRPGPAEIADRRTLRSTPADILVTNVTMLEYMLTRAQDRAILEASQGQLRWIVLDEAHSYVGAQAAEMALLLRRVRQGFGVDPSKVRLVATSATIGEGAKTIEDLRRFVADLGGVPTDQVDIILGQEAEPLLPRPGTDSDLSKLLLQSSSPAELWSLLAGHPRVQSARRMMQTSGQPLTSLSGVLCPEVPLPEQASAAERIIDAAAVAREAPSSPGLLPYRVHAFHRAQAGLWACVNPACADRAPELAREGADWPFGQIHLFSRDRCTCGDPVFEIVGCADCGTPWLLAQRTSGSIQHLNQMPPSESEDDYVLDSEPEDDDEPTGPSTEVLITPATPTRAGLPFRLSDAALRDIATDDPGHVEIHVTVASERACCPRAGHKTVGLVRQHFGAPFLLGNAIPSLLAGMPPAENPQGMPSGGRRLLSFTDSRQGTARFAAKLQQEAERNLTRAAIWHAVQEGGAGDPAKIEELQALIPILASNPALATLLAEKKRELTDLTEGAAVVSWGDMVSRLSRNVELIDHAGAVWKGRPYGGDVLAEHPDLLARLFLLREMFRRPRMQNNAETMGLARLSFPELERRAATNVPAALAEAGHGAEVWISLLLAAIDSEFRTNLAVDLATGFTDGNRTIDAAHWISPKQQTKIVMEPGTRPEDIPAKGRPVIWPTAKSDRRLVKLIFILTKGSAEAGIDCDRTTAVLAAIWTTLQQSGTIQKFGTGWQLSFAHAALARQDTAWLCPLTGRLQPYSLAGLSLNNIEAGPTLSAVALPRLPVARATGISSVERDTLHAWIEGDSNVAILKSRGLWTDLHDRAAEFAPFLRAQEHSAQIDRGSLQTYEDAFRQGRINILNCSTTMEMGVDIPNVGVVVNTNVPPAPTNYRQRVGRAGRRGEPWALSFTFCKDQPLDWSVFHAPEKLLSAIIPAPRVSLDSAVIVQRHVNALLLAMFLRGQGGIKVTTQIGTFLGATENPESPFISDPQADAFLVALRSEWATDPSVTGALKTLTTGTALEGQSALTERTALAFDDLRNRWRLEYLTLVDGQRSAPEGDATHNFYKYRARRMRRDFMMTDLARRGFTPAYGFPVDVVAFDHVGQPGNGSEGGPSRSLDIAIRDYAPGSEVVINGLVHRSDGILPAWGNRNDPDSVEDLRSHWTCRDCGAFGISRAPMPSCPACKELTTTREILRPSGFLGTSRPHVAYETLEWVRPDRPRVTTDKADWQTLSNAEIGRLRAERGGKVLFTASGPAGQGFAICIACGRAAAEHGPSSETAVPRALLGHQPLQPIRNNPRNDRLCPGNDESSRKIRRNVILGHQVATDVFELQLNALPVTEQGRGQALAIAAALREVVAARLGVEAEAIGTAAEPGHRSDGQRRMSICLFDRASGGAGFAVTAQSDLPSLLLSASKRLDCPANCVSGCPECILRRDVQYDLGSMDRPGAARILKEMLPHLALPDDLKLFGADSRAITEPLTTWLERRMAIGDLTALDLFFHGNPTDWDLLDWPLTATLGRLVQGGGRASISIAEAAIPTMELSEKLDLFRLLSRTGASLHVTKTPPEMKGWPITARVHWPGRAICVATRPDVSNPKANWGQTTDWPLIAGTGPEIAMSNPLAPMKLAQFQEGNSVFIEIATELDGPVAGFGQRFWKLIRSRRPQSFVSGGQLVSATYTDRYLRSPLTLRLLAELLKHLPGRTESTKISVITAEQSALRFEPRLLHDNWSDDNVRTVTMQKALDGVAVQLQPQARCPHPRRMLLEWSDGRRLSIHLDQGLGPWRTAGRPVPFDASRPADLQVRDLERLVFDIALQDSGRAPSPLWISW
ncbi:DEAD/DEAH box helicase [Tabrizicola sp. BL-A-41-H6]|uniref:DEAD/DEAH box helicase n=1 Tax=Tabrizicola sp. BL-A-41-H6 TaxID=3421107 RepID=UPI003D667130